MVGLENIDRGSRIWKYLEGVGEVYSGGIGRYLDEVGWIGLERK